VAILLLHVRHYWPFISDDALISLRYAARLIDGNGLTWTDGRPVEGYSNLLWVLLVALLGMFRIDLIDAARLLGTLGMVVVMLSVSRWYIGRDRLRVVWFPVTVGLLFVSLGAPMAIWVIGGLEQPLIAALLATSIPLAFSILDSEAPSRATQLTHSLLLGLLCLSRPDGALFTVAAVAALLAFGRSEGRSRVRDSLLVLAFPVLFYVGQLTFRMYYYGELVPNTALVKLTPSSLRLEGGLQYLSDGVRALLPLSAVAIAALVGLLIPSGSRRRAAYLLITALTWSAYVAFIGGDIFPGHRHMVPVIVVLAFALTEGCSYIATSGLSRPRYLYPLVALVFLLFVPFTQNQFNNKHNGRAVRERWEWEGKEVGLLLKGAFSKQRPLMAVTAAGCLPYWSELPALDMMGLSDYYLPRHPPADMGRGMIGHELGDGRYVLSRRPDLIVFNTGSGPFYRSGDELDRMAEFHRRYVPVTVRTTPGAYTAIIYVDKYSEKIGIVRSESLVRVPAFLLTGKDSVSSLNGGNKLVLTLTAGQVAEVMFDAPAQQDWSVDVRASNGGAIATEVRQDGPSLRVVVRAKGPDAAEIEEILLRSRR
jgi:arabinofuranosyltransferase